jgi:two-component system, OmpR family, sensor kinase
MIAWSLRTRLTIWYTFALLVVLCLFGADVLWQQGRIGLRRVDRDLDAFTDTLANVVSDELHETPNAVAAAAEAQTTVTAPGRAVVILDAYGAPMAAKWSGLALREPWPDAAGGPRIWTAETPGGAWRVHARPQTFGADTFVLLVATPLSDVRREQREVQEAMIVGIPIVLLLAGVGGLWLASVGLRPITSMARRAAQIPLNGLEDLGHTDRADELGQLAGAFNGLVARLRAALQTQRQFMADASHELRTPVSVIRTAADVALSRVHREEPEYRETLTIVGGEAQRVGRLVEDMLVLARADAGGYPLRPVDLYLDEVVAECRRAVDVLATGRGVRIESASTPEMPFRGDEALLRQMVLNVLQNAVQHTPCGKPVVVTLSQDAATVSICVRDSGPGIPAADQSRVFDRFVQLDPARRGHGSGLGLPIARWIAEAHGGTLTLERSDETGSTFCIRLSAQSPRDERSAKL